MTLSSPSSTLPTAPTCDVRTFGRPEANATSGQEKVRTPTASTSPSAAVGGRGRLVREIAFLLRQARAVWALIPARRKLGLGNATLLMAAASVCGTAIPLLIGQLVDGVQRASETRANALAFFRVSTPYLVLMGCAYVLRETLHVARRYLVEQSSTHI